MSTAPPRFERDVLGLFDVSLTSEFGGIEDYLLRILARCAAWFEASGASVFLRDGDRFSLKGQFGVDSMIPEDAVIQTGVGVAGACIESGRPMIVIDPTAEPMLKDRIARRRGDISSSMVVPLLDLEQRCTGVLNLSRRGNKRPFDESDLAVANSLGRHVALATANARLLSEARVARQETLAVLDSVGAAVWVVSRRGIVEDDNAAAGREFGQFVGRSFDSLLAVAPQGLASGLARARDRAIEGVDGRWSVDDEAADRAWTISASTLETGSIVLSAEDATDHRRASREVARMKRLAEIGQMTAAIAHEIRNPLTGIRSAAQVIASDPEHAVDFAAIIDEEVMKLNSLCDDFLEFARPLALREGDVDLTAIATSVAQSTQADFAHADVALTVEIAGEIPIITGDALRIEQVLRNLLRNALQASDAGSRVWLRIEPYAFEVEDEGHGMSAETVERLFTPFFTTKPQGTGLGMSNVKKIVEAHDAEIWVRSQPNEGTCIGVRFGGER